MTGLVKNAVFVTNGKGHPCGWGWAVTTLHAAWLLSIPQRRGAASTAATNWG